MGTALMARRNKQNTKGTAIAKAIMEEYQPQTREEMQDAIKDIFGPMFEAMLQGEMDSHLGNGNNERGKKEEGHSPMRMLYARHSICGLWNCIRNGMVVL